MVNSDFFTSFDIYLSKNCIADINFTVHYLTSVYKKLIYLECCKNFGFQIIISQISAVSDLSAAFCIERSFIQNNICITFSFN